MTPQKSLFDAPADSPLDHSVDWLVSTVFGEVAVVLCVLAVAFVGFLLLSGRLAVREGARVILGCFLLFGAPVIAGGLLGASERSSSVAPPVAQMSPAPTAREELPAAQYNPYAQASVRDDR